MDGKSDPTAKVWRRDVSVDQATKYLTKAAFKVDRDDSTDKYIYPYALYERMVTYVHDVIERVINLYQANFCMAQNHDLKHCTVEELSALV